MQNGRVSGYGVNFTFQYTIQTSMCGLYNILKGKVLVSRGDLGVQYSTQTTIFRPPVWVMGFSQSLVPYTPMSHGLIPCVLMSRGLLPYISMSCGLIVTWDYRSCNMGRHGARSSHMGLAQVTLGNISHGEQLHMFSQTSSCHNILKTYFYQESFFYRMFWHELYGSSQASSCHNVLKRISIRNPFLQNVLVCSGMSSFIGASRAAKRSLSQQRRATANQCQPLPRFHHFQHQCATRIYYVVMATYP